MTIQLRLGLVFLCVAVLLPAAQSDAAPVEWETPRASVTSKMTALGVLQAIDQKDLTDFFVRTEAALEDEEIDDDDRQQLASMQEQWRAGQAPPGLVDEIESIRLLLPWLPDVSAPPTWADKIELECVVMVGDRPAGLSWGARRGQKEWLTGVEASFWRREVADEERAELLTGMQSPSANELALVPDAFDNLLGSARLGLLGSDQIDEATARLLNDFPSVKATANRTTSLELTVEGKSAGDPVEVTAKFAWTRGALRLERLSIDAGGKSGSWSWAELQEATSIASLDPADKAFHDCREEVRFHLKGIRTAEKAYYAGFDRFLAIPTPNPRPVEALDTNAVDFGRPEGFDELGWIPDGPVRATFWVDGDDKAVIGHAAIDCDGDGVPARFTFSLDGDDRNEKSKVRLVTPPDEY